MGAIKLLIVDDSAFVRKVVREILSEVDDIEVVGTARNGQDALALTESLRPDVVTCDLNMPELDGVGFVRQQMAKAPLPILILTASPEDGDRVLEALHAGAVDFVQKPSALANENLFQIRQELIEKIRAAARAVTHVFAPSKPAPKVPKPASPSGAKSRFDIVVLGISTGGPQALRYMIPQLPANLPAALVIVLHMPIGYTAIFAEKLAALSPLPVKEAFEGCPVMPGQALLAPAGRHLSFRRSSDGQVSVRLALDPTEKPHRPSVDVLFQSAAQVYGGRVMGVVMTGMGDDGKSGAAWIKAQGGLILTEAEESCIIYGMPRSVVEAGLSDAAVPLSSMAKEITERL